MTNYLADDVGDIARRMKELALEKSVPTEQRASVPVPVPSKPLEAVSDYDDQDWDYGT